MTDTPIQIPISVDFSADQLHKFVPFFALFNYHLSLRITRVILLLFVTCPLRSQNERWYVATLLAKWRRCVIAHEMRLLCLGWLDLSSVSSYNQHSTRVKEFIKIICVLNYVPWVEEEAEAEVGLIGYAIGWTGYGEAKAGFIPGRRMRPRTPPFSTIRGVDDPPLASSTVALWPAETLNKRLSLVSSPQRLQNLAEEIFHPRFTGFYYCKLAKNR